LASGWCIDATWNRDSQDVARGFLAQAPSSPKNRTFAGAAAIGRRALGQKIYAADLAVWLKIE
jgi:hypothetical protein